MVETFDRRRIVKPTAPIPRIIIAHDAGSGTAPTAEANVKRVTGANPTPTMPEVAVALPVLKTVLIRASAENASRVTTH